MNGLAPRCRLIFSKICIRPKGWSADPKQGTWAGLKTMSISLVYISKINMQPILDNPCFSSSFILRMPNDVQDLFTSIWCRNWCQVHLKMASAHIWGLEICMRHKGWSDNSTQSYLPFVSRVKIDANQIGRIWWHMIRLLSLGMTLKGPFSNF